MSIGYTTTRGGLPIIEMPDVSFTAVTFSHIANTSSTYTPYNGTGQTTDLGGAKWQGNYSFNKMNLSDTDFGKLKAWKVKLRGAAGRFLGRDPSWCNKDMQLNKDIADSITVTIPEQNGIPLYPYTGVYPSESYPTSGYFAEYTFTLTYTQTAGKLTVLTDTESGTEFSISNSFYSILLNDNPWQCADGVHPKYKEYYLNAIAELERRNNIDINYGKVESVLSEGDYFQVDDHLAMVVDGSDPDKLTFEPPLRYPVTSGALINVENPSCVMQLVDDNQVSWSASGITAEFNSFTAMEAFT